MRLREKFFRIWFSDMGPMIWLLGIISLILAFGFFVGDNSNNNYELIHSTFGQLTWGFLFLTYGSILLARSLYYIYPIVMWLTYTIGVWMWSYIFFSFKVFDPTPTAATEWMLIIPIFAQVWIFFNSIYRKSVNQNSLVDLVKCVRCEMKSLSTELQTLNKETSRMKTEFDALSEEVKRISGLYK